MARLLSFVLASLATTCSVLGALEPGTYTISNGDSYLTLPFSRSVARFEPSTGGAPAQQWTVDTSDGSDQVILQSVQFEDFLTHFGTAPGTPLRGSLSPSSFIAVPQSEKEYILHPIANPGVAVGKDQASNAILQSIDAAPRLTFTPVS